MRPRNTLRQLLARPGAPSARAPPRPRLPAPRVAVAVVAAAAAAAAALEELSAVLAVSGRRMGSHLRRQGCGGGGGATTATARGIGEGGAGRGQSVGTSHVMACSARTSAPRAGGSRQALAATAGRCLAVTAMPRRLELPACGTLPRD